MSTQQNIMNNFTRGIECRLLTDRYYDYMLYKGGVLALSNNTDCLAAWIDLTNKDSYLPYNGIGSITEWDKAISSDFSLKHIGLTQIDNGFISFDKDEITQDEFNDIFLNSEMIFTKEDTTLALYPVTGNTKKYSYDYEFISGETDSYLSLRGGFFQGVFKVQNEDYEVLPYYIDEDWNIEFTIRPNNNYVTPNNTLNKTHSGATGMFFFIGTRAENKFAVMPDDEKIIKYSGETIDITDGIDNIELKTDNKHIFYNRTKTGSTVHNPIGIDENEFRTVVFEKTREYKDNAHKLFNRTNTGYTASDVKNGKRDDIYIDSGSTYDIMSDVIGNAFAIKYNNDGSISYRYTMKDCNAEDGWSLQEQTTRPGLVKEGEWNVINIRFSILDHAKDQCGVPLNLGNRKMKISIYINGYLVFISKELNEFTFRPLKVNSKFQECVPFNISLGGGTQGLADMITTNYQKVPDESYYLENNYAGTFIGDIRSFKIYTCMKQFTDIRNSYLSQVKEEKQKSDIKNDIVYYGFAIDSLYIIKNGSQLPATTNARTRYNAKSNIENSRFYVIISEDYIGTRPFEFTCGGAPMVMEKTSEIIENKKCIVYKSGEVYSKDAELSIISENF